MKNLFSIFLICLFFSSNIFYSQKDDSWKVYDDTEVAVIKITMNENDLTFMYDNPDSDSMHLASVHFKNSQIDEMVDSVGIRIRGNTSRKSYKKSLKLSFNTFVDGGEFYDLEKMNLNGEHNDPSIVRSKLSWDFFNEIGVVSTRATHVTVYINEKYYGLYISVEHIDEEFIQKNYDDDSGNLWKCLFGSTLVYMGNNPDLYKFENGEGERPYSLVTNEKEDDYSQLANLIYQINSSSNPNFEDSVEAIINVNGILKYLATNILVGGWDDYWSLSNNYYLYFNPETKKFDLIPYDYDNTFGVTWWDIDWASVNPYTFAQVYAGQRPLVDNILQRPKYRNLFSHYLEYYSNIYFGSPAFTTRLNELKTMISPYAEIDTFRIPDWGYTFQIFQDSFDKNDFFYTSGGSNAVIIPGSISDFVTERTSSLNSQINYIDHSPIIYDFKISSTKLQADEELVLTASVFSNKGISSVKAELTINNGSPELYTFDFDPVPSAMIIEEADRWTITLPSLGDSKTILLKIIAEDNTGGTTIFPNKPIEIITASTVASKEVLLSEVMSSNTNTIADENNEYDDWIEIYNPQASTIDLSDKYLTDKKDDLTKWQIPNGTTIASNQFLLFWCDEDQEQGDNHTNFKISAAGEFLAIVDSDGLSIIDSVTIPSMLEDESFSRTDNNGNWVISTTSTPGTDNIITDVADRSIIKHSFNLSAYPNPFNPTTTIKYEIPDQARNDNSLVTLKIYDILGKEVTTLLNEKQKSGSYNIEWNASNSQGRELTSGIYFVNINGEFFNKTIKLLLLR